MRRVTPLLMLLACGSEDPTLYVELRTDLVPGVEFVSVRTAIAEPARTTTEAASVAQDFISGERVAEIGDLPIGSRVVRVALLDAAGSVVADRSVRVDFDRTSGPVVLISRDCRSISCGASMTCVGGTCASVECHEELRPDACGVRECSAPDDCPAAPSSCADASCALGSCLYVAVPDGEVVDPVEDGDAESVAGYRC